MRKIIDLTGRKFERLVIIKRVENSKDGHAKWLCKCDCGNTKSIIGKDILSGKTKSCGCFAKQLTSIRTKKHNMYRTRIYYIWCTMKQRCYNPNNNKYKNYGGRGVKVCPEWLDKENGFMNFYNWAMNNGYDKNKNRKEQSLDRINNNGNYEPNNCRWATIIQQANNKTTNHYITYNGETHTITEWSKVFKIYYSTIQRRIKNNVPEDLLFYKGKITNKLRRKYEIK